MLRTRAPARASQSRPANLAFRACADQLQGHPLRANGRENQQRIKYLSNVVKEAISRRQWKNTRSSGVIGVARRKLPWKCVAWPCDPFGESGLCHERSIYK